MHKSGVLHSDLKPANLLLDENLTAKLGDFGISQVMPEFRTRTLSHMRTITASGRSRSHSGALRIQGSFGYMDPGGYPFLRILYTSILSAGRKSNGCPISWPYKCHIKHGTRGSREEMDLLLYESCSTWCPFLGPSMEVAEGVRFNQRRSV